ncbi:nucleolar protein,Nop52-domain-containing protein [Aspergillus karnatakaensis]|uniref:ribosomal RNA processing 1 family protein n=1 Tax=Aspergillus karnatakaensis TaxID=1810916 RepID=UPI003CCD9910
MADLAKTPFVRELASSDKKIRDKATESLGLFLRSKTDLSLLELLKLWKGLFFCFYHSDRPLTQQALARNLSYTLVPSLPRSTVHRFLRAFWITIGREWHNIDRIRLDKYLLLIRSYVGVAFQVFLKGSGKESNSSTQNGANKKRKREEKGSKKSKKNKKGGKAQEDDEEEEQQQSTPAGSDDSDWTDLKTYLDIISEGPLHPLNFDPDQPAADEKNGIIPMPHGPDGLRYHVLDIWIDEIEKAIEIDAETGKPVGSVPFEVLLGPVERLRKDSSHKPVRVRAQETLDDERLVEWGVKERKSVAMEEEDEESEEEWGGFGDE